MKQIEDSTMKLRVHYNPKQQVNDNKCFSPSAGKPEKVLNAWMELGNIEVVKSKGVSRSTLALAHDPEYVRQVLDLEINNGFNNKIPSVAASLPYTTGSMISGAIDSIERKTVTASLTSGFHHACYNHGGGFCTFNGILITAQYLKLHGFVERVAILDLDNHYGNGTDDIIKKLKLDYIEHWTLGQDGRGLKPKAIFKAIKKWFKEKASKCDIVLIQLGADACIDDPLGGFFSVDDMRNRDEVVFSSMLKCGLSGVFNIAGGYQEDFSKVIALHNISLIAWCKYFQTEEA